MAQSSAQPLGNDTHCMTSGLSHIFFKIFPFFLFINWSIVDFEQTLGDSGGQRSLACYSAWGHRVRHDLATEQQMAQTVQNPPTDAGDAGLIPGLGRAPGEGNGNPPQYSCQENRMNRGAWWAIFHEVTNSWI